MHWHNHHHYDQLPTHMRRQQASTNCICLYLESFPSWAKPNVCLAQMPLLTPISGDLSSLVHSKFWWHHYLQFCLSGLSCCVSGIISRMPNALINLFDILLNSPLCWCNFSCLSTANNGYYAQIYFLMSSWHHFFQAKWFVESALVPLRLFQERCEVNLFACFSKTLCSCNYL